jgi:hypothetical protein
MSGVSKVGFVLAILAVVAGCSSVVSTWVNPDNNPNATGHWAGNSKASHWVDNPKYQSGAGLAYFLPMGKVHITATLVVKLVTNYGVVKSRFGKDADGNPLYLTNLVSMTKVISNVVTQVYYTNNFSTNFFYPPTTLLYSNGVISSNTLVGPTGTNGSLTFNAISETNTNSYKFTISTNPFVTSATSTSQTTTISNQTAQPYSGGSTTSNSTTTTIYTEQPLITTNHTYNIVVYVDYQADPSNLFLLQPQMDWFHDDSANIIVDNRGLLSSINASNNDQTGNAVVSLAQAAVQSFELAGGMPIPSGGSASQQALSKLNDELNEKIQGDNEKILRMENQKQSDQSTPNIQTSNLKNELQDLIQQQEALQAALDTFKLNFPQQIDISFNPFDLGDLERATNELRNAGLSIVNPEDFLSPKQPNYSKWYNTPKNETGGIFYRPPIPYIIRIRDSVSNVVSATVLLPNLSPIVHLDMKKASFVAAISQVTLTNGFISSYSFSKPSSFMALATYPLVLLSDITSSLTNFIQFRINLGTGQNNLQNAVNSGQSIQNSAALAQQAAMITELSNSITLYNLTQALKTLTNSATGSTTTH